MWVLYEPVYYVVVPKRNRGCSLLLEVCQDLLDYLVRQYVVLVVANQVLWIHREQVHKALYPLGEEVIRVLQVVKSIRQHLPLLYELRNLAGVDVHYVPGVVNNVVCEDSTNVVRNLGHYAPYRLLRLVLPLFALDIVPQQCCELELVRKGEICLVKLLKGLWSCQCVIHIIDYLPFIVK